MADLLKRKLLPLLAAFALGMVLVAAVMRGSVPFFCLVPVCLLLLALRHLHRGRRLSLLADGLLTVFGLALAGLPVVWLEWLAEREHDERTPHFDLAQVENCRARLPAVGKFQLDGAIYFAHSERQATSDYGRVEPIYSRKHPRFPGNHSNQAAIAKLTFAPTPFVQLNQTPLERLVHHFLPAAPRDSEIRYQVCFCLSPDGWLIEVPGDLYVEACLERAEMLSLAGLALFSLGLCLLVANLGQQSRQRRDLSRWDREL